MLLRKLTIVLSVVLSLGIGNSYAVLSGPEAKTDRQEKNLAFGADSMVVTNNPWASKAAEQILNQGGNAFDAAIAAGFVLGLTEPQSSGIGGGGYALTYDGKSKKMLSYDGREVAPAAANPEWFLDKHGKPLDFNVAYKTAHAIGVPGEVALFYKMHQDKGKLQWDKLLQPAIDLANNGFPMSQRLYGLLKSDEVSLSKMPGFNKIFFTDDGKTKTVGTTIKNPEYANSLKRIAKDPKDFYTGQLAKDIVDAVNAKEGKTIYKLADMSNYKVITKPPVCSKYRNQYKICSIPPSSSGGVTVQELLLIYSHVSSATDVNDANWMYYFLEAGKLAYADRNQYLADPAFVKQPVKGLLKPSYIKARSKLISAKAMSTPVPAGMPDGIDKMYMPDNSIKAPGTTSLAIIDKDGNAVSMTVTIENQFGSNTFVDGFLLNNELTDFSFIPSTDNHLIANRVEAGKRPRSSIAPAMVFDKAGDFYAMAASPGGSQIICYVAKSLIYMLDFKQTPLQASSAGNLCATNGAPVVEADTELMSKIQLLNQKGESVVTSDMVSGEVNILKTAKGYSGAADPRREGVAIGD